MKIKTMDLTRLEDLKAVTDLLIGKDYYSLAQLKSIFEIPENSQASFILVDEKNHIQGFRITQAPGTWIKAFNPQHLSPSLWKSPQEHLAYFKSLFIDPSAQRQGWGTKLSKLSIQKLQELGVQGLLTHSWKESPSSYKYLDKLHFKVIQEHPLFWSQIDYHCPLCGEPPCQCTALEMYKDLSDGV